MGSHVAEVDDLGWVTEFLTEDPDNYDVSVWPVADDVEHNLDDPSACMCVPIVEELIPGSLAYTHQAADGRP